MMLLVKASDVVQLDLDQIQEHNKRISKDIDLAAREIFPLYRNLYPTEMKLTLHEVQNLCIEAESVEPHCLKYSFGGISLKSLKAAGNIFHVFNAQPSVDPVV